jgi:hypothetical protein
VNAGLVGDSIENFLSVNLAFCNTQQRVIDSFDGILKSKFKSKTGNISPSKIDVKLDLMNEKNRLLFKVGINPADYITSLTKSQLVKGNIDLANASARFSMGKFKSAIDNASLNRYRSITELCPGIKPSMVYILESYSLAPPLDHFDR